MRFSRITTCLLFISLPITLPGCRNAHTDSQSVSFPSKRIELIVPFAPGGSTDTFARMMKQSIDQHELLSKPIVIVNVDGAGGTVGSRRVKQAAPDGHTLMLLHDAIVTAQMAGTVSYGPDAFEAVAGTGQSELIVAVADGSRYQHLDELIEAATAEPDTISFGANLGAMSHIAALLLERASPDARFRMVQTGGGAERFAALKGGHVSTTLFSVDELVRFRSGGVRAIAILSSRPHPAIPDVPTASQLGYPVNITNMQYWWVPKGTAPDRIHVLEQTLKRAFHRPQVQDRLAQLHIRPIYLSGQKLEERIASISSKIGQIRLADPPALPNFEGIVITLTGLLFLGTVISLSRHHVSDARETVALAAGLPSYGLLLACLIMSVAYVTAMSLGVGYRAATMVYILAVGGLLVRFRPRQLPAIVLLALVLSLAVHWLLNRLSVLLP